MDSPLQLSFVNFKKDSYIIVEGKQNADRFFIIRSGKVRIAKDVEVVEAPSGVQVRVWLVEEEEVRVRREAVGDDDALQLAARELA